MAKRACYTAGDHDGMTEIFHLIIIYVLATICMIEIIISIIITVKELPKRKNILTKFKLFMVPLLVTDFLIGCTFVLLFVLELSKDGEDVDCDISIPRILMYLYYYVTRTIALAYILFLTYNKTKETLPTPTQKHDADTFTFVINVSLLWSPGISALLCFGFSSVETNSILATLTFIYFVMTMACSSACHFMVFRALSRDKSHEDSMTFTDTKYYRDALRYVKVSFVCFVAINVPLFFCAIIFVVHTFAPDHSRESRLLQDLYLVSIALVAIESIGNPLLFVNNINNVKKGLCKTCSIIIFKRQIKYRESFKISFKESKLGKERQLAALAAAENTRDEGLVRGDNTGGELANTDNVVNETSNRDKLLRGRNNVIVDEAGIEIEHEGLFDNRTNDITLGIETIACTTTRAIIGDVREIMFEYPEPQVFGDWRNHAVSHDRIFSQRKT